ncbi:flagellar biosynthesis anti-sigma factor FlgM [Nitrosomonas sp. Nm132]|uniref:flagellar biosynthesis anti-sigma factor FlgM n=1 Tax=Nitrosomonas sp. Nm132 TaxID=1881053 RepID=UPI00087ED613|nr:flagellar biosynthesis anti-sigma factor FlgM [Nitrosomonas sp. Nm132]SDI17392.1 negative regulator of flagellin synthesis FlgM [Nitrosomonas sp. Nm132]
MKIDNSNPTRTNGIISNKQECDDKIISIQSSDLSQAENSFHINPHSILSHSIENNSGAVDIIKVEEIKQAIIEGRFKVNSDVVADRLLEVVKELIQSENNK